MNKMMAPSEKLGLHVHECEQDKNNEGEPSSRRNENCTKGRWEGLETHKGL